MKQIYIITYENIQWCGGELTCLVKATDATDAEMLAGEFMENTQRELFDSDEDGEDYDGPAYTVNKTELLAGSEYEKYAADPGQQSFYPKVNF